MKSGDDKFTMLDKFGLIFSEPKNFFNKIKLEKNIGGAIGMYLLIAIIAGVAGSMFYSIMGPSMRMYSDFIAAPMIGFYFVFGVVSTFIYAGVMHLLLIFTKRDANYVDSYNVYTYSLIPAIVLSIVPYGFLAVIYSFALMIIGMSEVHGISKGKATFVVLMPIVILIGLLILFVASLFYSF